MVCYLHVFHTFSFFFLKDKIILHPKSSKLGLPRENAHHITNDYNERLSVKQTEKGQI